MSSKYSNKHNIPKEFQQILNNFTKTIIRYKPKDIIDFAIYYFISLEKEIPLDRILDKSKYVNVQKKEASINNEQKFENKENAHLDESNSKGNLEDTDDFESNKRIPITRDLEEIIKIQEIENKKSIKKDIDSEIVATNAEKEKVKDFISELFIESE